MLTTTRFWHNCNCQVLDASAAQLSLALRQAAKLHVRRQVSQRLAGEAGRWAAPRGSYVLENAICASVNMLELARERVLAAFETHWRRILHSSTDIAKERERCFLAASASARERVARKFYDREHARQMASLNQTEVRETLSPWLEHALRYWLDEFTEIGDAAGDNYLAELPTAEYVSIVCGHGSMSGGALVDRYPGERALYDDLYERMLSGFSCGGVLRVYKSTGERFTPLEMRSARAGIRRDLLAGIASDGSDEPWVFDMEAEGKWDTDGFMDEDFERVVIVEVNDYGEGLDVE